MFSSSKWIFRVINIQIVTIITIISLFLCLCLFLDLRSSSSCDTDMATLTILTNPVAIHPKKKSRKIMFSSTLDFHQPIFHSHARALFHSLHYLYTYFLLYAFFCSSHSFSPHSPLSAFLPLHPTHSRIIYSPISYLLCLTYQSPALTFSLLLCLSVSASPWALSGPCTPMSESAERAWNIDGPRRRPPPAHSAGGTGQDRRHKESEWLNFSKGNRYATADGGEVEWSEWGTWWSVCACVCKNHVIPAASWLLHMHLMICFQVIWRFIRGRARMERADSWAGLFPYSAH